MAYYLCALFCFFLKWRTPCIQTRSPILVTLSAVGLLVRNLVFIAVLFVYTENVTVEDAFMAESYLILVVDIILQPLIYWPTLIRFYSIYNFNLYIQAFFLNRN